MRNLLLLAVIICTNLLNAQDVPVYVPQNGLIAWYPFNGNALDMSGNQNHGIIEGPEAASDRFGNPNSSFLFNPDNPSHISGKQDIVRIPHDSSFDSEYMTVSVWSKLIDFNTENGGVRASVLIERFDILNYSTTDTTVANFQIALYPVVDFARGIDSMYVGGYLAVHNETYNMSNFRSNINDIRINEWNHIVMTYDGENHKLYLNGEIIYNIPITGKLKPNKDPILIGQRLQGNGYYYHTEGYIDDIGIWNRALTEDEVKRLYQSNENQSLSDVTLTIDSVTAINASELTTSVSIDELVPSDSISAYEIEIELPDNIDFVGLDRENTLSENGSVLSNIVGSRLKISYASENYIYGNDRLIKLRFESNFADDYLITPVSFILNNTTIDRFEPGLLSFAIRVGDVDNNSLIQAYDAALVLQYSAGLDPIPGIDPLPWKQWRVAASDANIDGIINAFDASRILQFNVGLIQSLKTRGSINNELDALVSYSNSEIIINIEDEGLYGFNINLPEVPTIRYGEPNIQSDNSLYALNQEDGLKIALASTQSMVGDLIKIPVESTGSQTIDFEYSVNSRIRFSTIDINPVHTSVDENETVLSNKFELSQNYPNPFNPVTQISYNIPKTGFVKLSVFNMRGQKVTTLVNSIQNVGHHQITFDGSSYPSGIYFYTLETEGRKATNKMLLLK